MYLLLIVSDLFCSIATDRLSDLPDWNDESFNSDGIEGVEWNQPRAMNCKSFVFSEWQVYEIF